MARNRLPLEKAIISGSAAKNPQRFRNRNVYTERPLGQPYPKMTELQKKIWHELDNELPWLKASHRMMMRLTCVVLAKMESDKDVGVSTYRTASVLLSKLGATPVDESRVGVSFTTCDDGLEEFFR